MLAARVNREPVRCRPCDHRRALAAVTGNRRHATVSGPPDRLEA